jgi:hypothetical protein
MVKAIVVCSILCVLADAQLESCAASPGGCLQNKEATDMTTLMQSRVNVGNGVSLVEGSKAARLQADLGESQRLSSVFDVLSKNKNVKAETQELFRLFRICGQCNHFVRLGEANDGGYLTCVDHNASNPSLGAFSLGVEQHDKWSEDVVSILGAQKVSQYDCTVKSPPVACPRCQFNKKCIRGASQIQANDPDSWTLQEAVTNAGFANAASESLIMKMDIEGSEWGVLTEFGSGELQKFKQIIIEFHHLSSESDPDKYVKAQMNLKSNGFVPVHLHGNNYEGMYNVGSLTVPNVLEVTYLRDSGNHNCVADQQYLSLDAPNNPGAAELPTAHLDAR